MRIVGIRFKKAGRVYDFDAGVLELAFGDDVIIEVEKGIGFGCVAKLPSEVTSPESVPGTPSPTPKVRKLKRVVRKADPVDLERKAFNKEREGEAFSVCADKIKEYKLPMKLVNVEYLFDSSKAIFYFTSESRVDFRVLVKDMAAHLFTRIEMRQIGVRDEAKLLGGFGPCGRELCCASFLDDFKPVTVRMAKEQGLALNPLKISGVCGRLMCCLSYEHDGSAKKRGGKKQGAKGRDGQRNAQSRGGCCATKKESGGGSCACPSKRTDRKDGDKPRKLQGDIHMDGATSERENRDGEGQKDSPKRERGGRGRNANARGGKGRPDRREKIKDPRKAPLKADVHMEGVVPDAMSNKDGQRADGQRTDGQRTDGQRPDGQRPDSQRPDSQRPDGQPKRRSRRRGRRRGFRKSKEGGGGTSSSGSSSGSSTGGGKPPSGGNTPSTGGSNDK